jgi:pimeloyl-ACP methyl ester carboxylesterase
VLISLASMIKELLLLLIVPSASQDLNPIVIVPGFASSRIEARLDKPSTVSYICQKKADEYRLWLDSSALLLTTSCWSDNAKLLYNETSDTLSNNYGVESYVPDFGGTSAFEELDLRLPLHLSDAFRNMVENFVNHGYQRNISLRGAPYDFRYAPSSPVGAKYIHDLKQLIEETFHINGGRKVTLISHSWGSIQFLYLLQGQSQSWKDTFIEQWIAIAGAFAGSVKETRMIASGDNLGLPVSASLVVEVQRSYETTYWLSPVPSVFKDRVLVTSPSRNYTAQDYDDFFSDVNFTVGKKLMNRVAGLTAQKLGDHPGVKVHCLYSLGVPTPERYVYRSSDWSQDPEIINGDGDGAVNAWSLQICESWKEHVAALKHNVTSIVFPEITHAGMIMDNKVLHEINKILGIGQETSTIYA